MPVELSHLVWLTSFSERENFIREILPDSERSIVRNRSDLQVCVAQKELSVENYPRVPEKSVLNRDVYLLVFEICVLRIDLPNQDTPENRATHHQELSILLSDVTSVEDTLFLAEFSSYEV